MRDDEKPVRHHYVPATYLRGFDEQRIQCLDKTRNIRFAKSPEKIAFKNHYNTVEHIDGSTDQTTLEAFYSKNYETDLKHWLEIARNGPVPADGVTFLTTFATAQRMRTPATREGLRNTFIEAEQVGLIRKFQDQFSDEGKWLAARARKGEEKAIEQIALRLSGHFGMATAGLFDRMSFLFLPTEEAAHLITSDNPVFLCSLIKRNGKLRPSLPFPDRRLVCLFPLAKDLLMYGDTFLKNDLGFNMYPLDTRISSRLVKKLNRVTAITASRQIFASRQELMNFLPSDLKSCQDGNWLRSKALMELVPFISREILSFANKA